MLYKEAYYMMSKTAEPHARAMFYTKDGRPQYLEAKTVNGKRVYKSSLDNKPTTATQPVTQRGKAKPAGQRNATRKPARNYANAANKLGLDAYNGGSRAQQPQAKQPRVQQPRAQQRPDSATPAASNKDEDMLEFIRKTYGEDAAKQCRAAMNAKKQAPAPAPVPAPTEQKSTGIMDTLSDAADTVTTGISDAAKTVGSWFNRA